MTYAPLVWYAVVPRRGKLDLERIRASLNTPCPQCGHNITPEKRTQVDKLPTMLPLTFENYEGEYCAAKVALRQPNNAPLFLSVPRQHDRWRVPKKG
jgi:hypothetical protein